MKYIVLLLLTITLAFSSSLEKKIILGTFTHAKYAQNRLHEVQQDIEKNNAMKNFMDLNNLSLQVENIKSYNVVSIKPFSSYKKLLYMLNKLDKKYTDLYVLPPYKGISSKPKLSKVTTVTEKKALKIEPVKQITPQPKVAIAKETVVKIVQTPIAKEPIKESKKITIKKPIQTVIIQEEVQAEVQNDLLLDEDIDDTFDKTNLFNYKIVITIIIVIILLLILINTIIKMNRSSKKEKYTPYKADS